MKAMILDVDGTLWDTTGVVAEAWMQAASELMIPSGYSHYRGPSETGIRKADG